MDSALTRTRLVFLQKNVEIKQSDKNLFLFERLFLSPHQNALLSRSIISWDCSKTK